MYTFIVDETNRDFVANHFFIVGGLIFTEDQVRLVDESVRLRRERAGYRPGDSFKFNTNERPSYVSPQQHREAKKLLVSDLRDIGVRMVVSVVLHELCRGQDYHTRMNWALNTLAGAYRRLLVVEEACGFMLLDRDNDRFDHLEYLFQHGLEMHGGGSVRVDDKIFLFGMTNDNASNIASAADIALGAFRYCANTAVGAGRDEVAHQMFPTLSEIMWSVPVAGQSERLIAGYGYNPRPKVEKIYKPELRERYRQLAASLRAYSL